MSIINVGPETSHHTHTRVTVSVRVLSSTFWLNMQDWTVKCYPSSSLRSGRQTALA